MSRRRTSQGPQRHALHRLVLAVFALALSGVHLVGLGHLLFVTHVICEHGALLHTEEALAHVDEPAPADVDSAAPGLGEHHQHCDAFAVETTAVAVEPAFSAPAPLSFLLASEAPASPFAHRPIGLLALAPKASPPSPRSFL
jgi:hypothetical protein